ncbi:MAG: helix-turn-helix transcriptional regulator, partial [Oscillospiraceae bacterium]|nr:helix-turn-helix transcriptional regulator [Oscillospiraceae bacterium]
MILADKIVDLRKKNGWSQEELAEKLDVSRQAVSKWESAQSVPDMSRVLRMSQLFGVSTDYLLKDEMEAPAESPVAEDAGALPVRTVGMEEANAFLSAQEKSARHIALGVLLCILSPIWPILICGGQEQGLIRLSASQAAGLSVPLLLLMVGAAVALFVTTRLRMGRFAYLDALPIDTLYGVDGMARERREQFRPTRNTQLTVGIVLCVLAVIPVFSSMLFFGAGENFAHLVAVSALLALVGVGVLLIVRSSILWIGFQKLLQE